METTTFGHFEKSRKNFQKGVDKRSLRCYITQARGSDPMFSPETTNEKFQKNLKKVVDKQKTTCYNNQAVADKAGRGCTLKIEQCKNSLCKISTKEKGS